MVSSCIMKSAPAFLKGYCSAMRVALGEADGAPDLRDTVGLTKVWRLFLLPSAGVVVTEVMTLNGGRTAKRHWFRWRSCQQTAMLSKEPQSPQGQTQH